MRYNIKSKKTVSLISLLMIITTIVIYNIKKEHNYQSIDILNKAIEESLALKETTNTNVINTYYIDPLFPDEFTEISQKYTESSFKKLNKYIANNVEVVNIFSYSRQYEESVLADKPDVVLAYNRIMKRFTNRGQNTAIRDDYTYNNAVTLPLTEKGKIVKIIQLYRFPHLDDKFLSQKSTIAHQVFHAVETMSSEYENDQVLPMWLEEGSSMVFAYGMVSDSSMAYMGRLAKDHTISEDNDAKKYDGYDILNTTMLPYERAMAADTYIIGLYGYDKFFEFTRETNRMKWNEAFKKVYGKDVGTLYPKLNSFIKWEMEYLDSIVKK